MRRPGKQTIGYVLALSACFALAIAGGWFSLGTQIDNYAYDWLFRLHPVKAFKTQSIVLAIDDNTLNRNGGMRKIRSTLVDGLERLALAGPRAVALDITLADTDDDAVDKRLETALGKLPNLILACDLIESGWQDPPKRFSKSAAALGHVHADADQLDTVARHIPLEKVYGRDRRWALSLQAFRLSRGGGPMIESPGELLVAGTTIPTDRNPVDPMHLRLMRVRYLPVDSNGKSQIPSITLQELKENPELAHRCAGKVVFVGVTSQTAASDRLMTPLSGGRIMPGVEIHAQAFETMNRGEFLPSVSPSTVIAFCLALVAVAGITFRFLWGWKAYAVGGFLLLIAHLAPHWMFSRDLVLPYFEPAASAWLALVTAATYQHFIVRRQLSKAQADKSRYQQAIHFVTHEMRTPLTAIQGSSELMTRYNIQDEKRKQMAQMINSESKRLARMIQTFLDVERMTEGQLELKKAPFPSRELVSVCVERARPIADRKQIRIEEGEMEEAILTGDRELMEYAYYNLLTNAIKYSAAETTVTLTCKRDGENLRLTVRDQGIGMDEKELKNIFRKFYRTRKAEASGEVGTGIGLSIVEEIVTHHGGRIEVSSRPGKGSSFTLVLPATVTSPASGVK